MHVREDAILEVESGVNTGKYIGQWTTRSYVSQTHRMVRMMFRNRWNVQPTARNTPSGGTAGSRQEEVRNMNGVWRSRYGVSDALRRTQAVDTETHGGSPI